MKKLHLFIGGASAAGLLVLAVPVRRPSDTEPEVSPVVEAGPTVAPPVDSTTPASAEALAAQRARRDGLAWGRNPFADPTYVPVAELAVPDPEQLPELPDEPRVDLTPAPVEASAPLPRLTGISRQGTARWAIIDREVVREGDSLPSGHRIARIDGRTVTLMLDREPFVLSLGGGQ